MANCNLFSIDDFSNFNSFDQDEIKALNNKKEDISTKKMV